MSAGRCDTNTKSTYVMNLLFREVRVIPCSRIPVICRIRVTCMHERLCIVVGWRRICAPNAKLAGRKVESDRERAPVEVRVGLTENLYRREQ